MTHTWPVYATAKRDEEDKWHIWLFPVPSVDFYEDGSAVLHSEGTMLEDEYETEEECSNAAQVMIEAENIVEAKFSDD